MKKVESTHLPLFTNYMRDRGLRESTAQMYTAVVRRFLASDPDVESLDEYNNFLIKHAVKKSQYNYPYALMKFIEYIIEDTKLKNELTKGIIIRPLRERQKDRARLTTEQIKDVIHNIALDKYKLIANLQFETGVRANDIISGMTTKNIHEDTEDSERILRLRLETKGRKMVDVILRNQKLIDELLFYSKLHSKRIIIPQENIDDEFVFISPPKRETTNYSSFYLANTVYHSYWEHLKKALNTCGIDYKDWATHDFRRNFARVLYKKSGHDIELLKNALNHSRLDTTVRYIKSSPEEVQKMIKRVQQDMHKEKKKELIILKDECITGKKVGDIIPEPENINEEEAKNFILEKIKAGELKYV